MPAQKLTDGIDLVIVTAVRKARDLGPKIIKPRRMKRTRTYILQNLRQMWSILSKALAQRLERCWGLNA
jgi:hypothetical protein